MARVRSIEFIGGPLCGSVPLVPDGQDVVVWTDGAAVYEYQRDELVEGPSVREVFRFSSQVPLPRREGNDG